jgi:hypothetical protein
MPWDERILQGVITEAGIRCVLHHAKQGYARDLANMPYDFRHPNR